MSSRRVVAWVLLGWLAALWLAPEAAAAGKKVLIFGNTMGFRHGDAIKEGSPILQKIAEGLGYEAVVSEDPATLDPDTIKQWDLLIFNNTTGDPLAEKKLVKEDVDKQGKKRPVYQTIPHPERRKALIERVKEGAGWIGIHSAADSLYDFPEFNQMVNGWFSGHPWSGKVKVTIEEPDHPLMKPFGKGPWEVSDEIYQFRNYDRTRARILMSIYRPSVEVSRGNRKDRDYATCWISLFGKGRVMYQAHGHGGNAFKMPEYQEHMKLAMQWAVGDIEVPVEPSKVEDPAVVAARAVEKLRAAKTDDERIEALDLAAIAPSKEALAAVVAALEPASKAAPFAADAAQAIVAASPDLPKDQKVEALRKALDCCGNKRDLRKGIRAQLTQLGVADLPIYAPPGFVTHWFVAGPISNKDSAFLGQTYPPEAGVDLERGFIVKGEGEPQTFAWKKVTCDDDGIVKLRDLVSKADAVGGYLYAEISIERETPVQVLLGAREHFTAWLNGEKLGEQIGTKGLRPGQFKYKATLKPGANRLLVKVSQTKGDWGACAQIVGPKNEKIAFTAREK
ncbi:MAG TPA: ThuA domain-containing protein [Planctomycetota bacterium]|nr:ThuA domain-containing protein [Planctomycetota bacterium]